MFTKKIFASILLGILIFSGLLFVSQKVNAADTTPASGSERDCTIVGTVTETTSGSSLRCGVGIIGFMSCVLYPPAAPTTTTKSVCVDGLPTDDVSQKMVDFLTPSGLVGGISRLLLYGAFKLASYSSYLFSAILAGIVSLPITQDPAFTPAWTLVRDLANMVIVLGFVVVGIATALRIQSYAAKNLLFKLIVIAIVVNFSALACGLIIDASNLTMNGVLGLGASSNSATGGKLSPSALPEILLGNVATQGPKILNQTSYDDTPYNFAGMALCFTFIYLGIALTFFYLSAILIARYAILVILFILSPLAFAFWVFPATNKWFTEWWQSFLKWAFVGAFGSFVLSLIPTVMDALTDKTKAGGGGFLATLVTSAVILIFLFVGFKMTAASNGIASMAAGGAIGLVKGAAGLAVGAGAATALGLGRMANRLTGDRLSAPGGAVSRFAGKTLERVGLRQEGSTAAANSKRVEEHAGMLAKEYAAAKATNDKGTIERMQRQAQTTRGARGAALMKVLADNKDLGEAFAPRDSKGQVIKNPTAEQKATSMQKINDRLRFAEVVGATNIREKAEKSDPRLRAFNPQHVEKHNNPESIKAHGSARAAAVAEGYSKASVPDIKEFSSDALEDPSFVRNTPINKIVKASEDMSGAKIKSIQKNIPDLEKQHEAALASGDTKKAAEIYKKWCEINLL